MTEQEIREALVALTPIIEQARAEKDQARLAECLELLDLLEHQLLPKQKEILFLPYKASMWDSLESIWRTAMADENCHAVVVPIPYAERNEDGSCREWHCEAELFPADVPVEDWQSYDIPAHHPDVIYIHNPYDDSNRLTMVEPRFFSRNLRPYTDMLVYVPYFAWSGYWPASHLNLPCYAQVDKIIVQTEKYLVLTEDCLEKDAIPLVEVMPAGKLVILGSPKLDRIWWCEKHKEISEAWTKKIAGHKVVLYNTSVFPVMSYGARSLVKMRQTIQVFARHSELVLLWRPHPLLETMLRSQKPELLEEYHQIVSEFQGMPNGIYDTTPDVDQSTALADAYLGDGSSVMQLFAVLGKPIFCHDLLIGEPSGDDQQHLAALAMVTDDGMMYFWAEYLNALCRMEIQTGHVDILCELTVSPYVTGNFGSLVKWKSHLVLVPLQAQSVVDYDLRTGKYQQILLESPMNGGNFRYAEVYGNRIFMIGCRYPAILIYTIDQGVVRYERDCFQGILADRSGRHEEMLGKPCRVEERLYIPVLQSNHVLEYSMDDGTYVLHKVGPNGAGYGYATFYDGVVWLAPWMGGPIARWVPTTGEYELFDQFPHGFAVETMPGSDEAVFFGDAVLTGPYWWLMPCQSNLILRVDLRNGSLASVQLGFDLSKRSSSYFHQLSNVWCGAVWQEWLLVWCGYDRNIRVLNRETGAVEAIWQVMLSKKDLQVWQQRPLEPSDFHWLPQDNIYAIREDGLRLTVENFCHYVADGRHDREVYRRLFEPMAEHADGTCGVHIHEYIMQCLSEKREQKNETE